MGWKGTVRSVSAGLRAIERDAERRRKAALKAQIADDSAAAVADWEAHTDELTSIHTSLAKAIDWQAIAAQPRPIEPQLETIRYQSAETALAAFKPGFLNIFYGGTKRRRARLEAGLAAAPEHDRADYEKSLRSFQTALKEWETDTTLARQLVAGEPSAIREVIEEMQSLSDQSLVGSTVSFSISEDFLHAKPVVHSDDIVPDFRRKQLASGKLSETKTIVKM